ncbi:alcohol dehydrogenase catalytic domain-containing protein [Saccharopolyspora shandongensis]|uniref:alcohol dehydrogenase catalytic domain-containing protein n=1 Tax=Saccharopolyspora shandongensis TaxID=418495 RepID=UPI003447036A
MRAAVISWPGVIGVGEAPDPEPGLGQVVVRVRACGVCGLDVLIADGELASVSYPIVPGHEFSGEIVALGPGAPTKWRVGDRVTVDPILPCGQCAACCSDYMMECEQRGAIGETVNGAFAEYVAVPAANCYRMPDSMTWAQAAMVEPASRALRAVRRFGVVAGQRALVVGANATGLLLLQVQRLSGVKVTLVDRDPGLLDLAMDLGAFAVATDIAQVGGEKFDVAIDCTSDPEAMEGAFDAVHADGRLLVFGTPHASGRIQLSRVPFYDLQAELNRSMAVLNSFGVALELIASGSIRTDPLLTHALPLASFDEALKLTRSGAELKVQVLPDFEALDPERSIDLGGRGQ